MGYCNTTVIVTGEWASSLPPPTTPALQAPPDPPMPGPGIPLRLLPPWKMGREDEPAPHHFDITTFVTSAAVIIDTVPNHMDQFEDHTSQPRFGPLTARVSGSGRRHRGPGGSRTGTDLWRWNSDGRGAVK